MRNSITPTGVSVSRKGNHYTRLLTLVLPLFLFNVFAFYTNSAGQSANLDQIRNGLLGIYPITPEADWVNGNAGPSNAHFAEGYSIPYRARISGLVGNSSTTHTLVIEWDTKHSNGHALDYITHYANLDNPTGSHIATFGHAAETINPIMGTAFNGAPLLVDIPAPSSTGSEVAGQPTTSFNNLPTVGYTNNANINKFAAWGATDVVLAYDFETPPDGTTAQTQTRLIITFKSIDGSTALFAWGGHIAAEYDWGAGRGATGVSGSPYHTRIIAIDGKPGNQDRSLKATAVIIPPPLCGISAAQYACPETTSLTFSATGSSTGSNVSYEWTLTNGTPSAGAKISGSNTGFSITVVPIGATFLAGGTFSLSLKVNKTGAESTTCNRTPAGTIINVVATAAATPTNIDITSASHSTTLTASIGAASTNTDVNAYTYQWSIVGSAAGSLTNANQRIATYTAALADASQTIYFKVVATLNVTDRPACTDDATVSVPVSSVGTCDVSPQTEVCQGTTTTHTGSPSPKPANATYTWSLEAYGGGGTTNSTLIGTNGGVSIQVDAQESYRIVLSQIYANTALNTSCYEDVLVKPTPTVASTYIAPATCADRFFSVQVTSPVVGYSYSIDQTPNNKDFSSQNVTYISGNLIFTGLIPGDGYVVTVTTNGPACTATDVCGAAAPAITSEPATPAAVKENTEVIATSTGAKEVAVNKIELPSTGKVTANPNPFTSRVRFSLVSSVTGHGSLDLFNAMGQKVATVYEGYFQAGREVIKEYNGLNNQKGTLIYVFRVGEQKVTGKLISQ